MTPASAPGRRRGCRFQRGRRRQAGLGRARLRHAARRLRPPRGGGRRVRGDRAPLPRPRPARGAQQGAARLPDRRVGGGAVPRGARGAAGPPAPPRRAAMPAARTHERPCRRLPPAAAGAELRGAQDAGGTRHRRSAPRAGAARRVRTAAASCASRPRRTCCIPHVPDARIGDLTQEPLLRELPYNPSEVQRGLVSCTGTDFCNLALIDTKTRAMALARDFEQHVGAYGRSPSAGPAARPPAAITTPPTSGSRAAR